MRIDATLKAGTESLRAYSSTARLDAEILLAFCLAKPRSYLYTWPEKTLSAQQQTTFDTLLKKRQDNYPVAYMTGYQEFWSLNLKVTPDVLIPRADTELLVEVALDKISNIQNPSILELGTGSGAIALALASERPDANITATDLSEKALAVAEINRKRYGFDNVEFLLSNWFNSIPKSTYDIIVSNPPYIDPTDNHLAGSIRHEPIQALTAKSKGLGDLTQIANGAMPYLKKTGWIILEHGYDQGKTVSELLKKAAYTEINCLSDLSGNDRINLGAKP